MKNKAKNHYNKKMCAKCKGECCKQLPGCIFPEDVPIINERNILDLLITRNYAIDYWEGDIRKEKNEWHESYFLRPATKKDKGKIIDPSWGGECIFLNDTGCKLNDHKRPFGCRILEPARNGEKCRIHNGGKNFAALAWVPYRNIFEKIIKSTTKDK